jgi:hypothetical protein
VSTVDNVSPAGFMVATPLMRGFRNVMRGSPRFPYGTKRFALRYLLPVLDQMTMAVQEDAHGLFMLGMRLVDDTLLLGGLVVRHMPELLALRMLLDGLQPRALRMGPLLVGSLLVRMALYRAAFQLVRMAQTRNEAADPVSPMNNSKHRVSPPT